VAPDCRDRRLDQDCKSGDVGLYEGELGAAGDDGLSGASFGEAEVS
jgi:hypothetical protein